MCSTFLNSGIRDSICSRSWNNNCRCLFESFCFPQCLGSVCFRRLLGFFLNINYLPVSFQQMIFLLNVHPNMRRWSHLTVLKLETILKLTVQHETTSSSCYVNVSKARFDHQLGSQLRVVEQSYGWFRGSSWREDGQPCTGAKHGNFQNGWGRDAGGKLLVTFGRLDHELSLAWWGSVDIFRCFVNCQVTWHLRVANGCKRLVLHCGSFKTCPIKRTRYLGFRGDSDHSWVRTGRCWKFPTLVFTVVVLFVSFSGLVP